MSSTATHIKGWAPLVKVAPCLHCSTDVLHKWGKAKPKLIGYRQLSPKHFEVDLARLVPFYIAKFPNIEIDMEALMSLSQSTT